MRPFLRGYTVGSDFHVNTAKATLPCLYSMMPEDAFGIVQTEREMTNIFLCIGKVSSRHVMIAMLSTEKGVSLQSLHKLVTWHKTTFEDTPLSWS